MSSLYRENYFILMISFQTINFQGNFFLMFSLFLETSLPQYKLDATAGYINQAQVDVKRMCLVSPEEKKKNNVFNQNLRKDQ